MAKCNECRLLNLGGSVSFNYCSRKNVSGKDHECPAFWAGNPVNAKKPGGTDGSEENEGKREVD